ncbi:unnamed protein product, partial [Rotaria sp. Silwood1]
MDDVHMAEDNSEEEHVHVAPSTTTLTPTSSRR